MGSLNTALWGAQDDDQRGGPPQLLLLLAIYIGRALVDPPYITGPDRKSLLKPWSNSENATCSASLSRAEGRWWSISSAVFVASFCCFTPLPLCDDIYCSSFHHFRFPTLCFFSYQFFLFYLNLLENTEIKEEMEHKAADVNGFQVYSSINQSIKYIPRNVHIFEIIFNLGVSALSSHSDSKTFRTFQTSRGIQHVAVLTKLRQPDWLRWTPYKAIYLHRNHRKISKASQHASSHILCYVYFSSAITPTHRKGTLSPHLRRSSATIFLPPVFYIFLFHLKTQLLVVSISLN